MTSRSAEDLVRVQWGTMNDGLAGLMWRDGLSDPLVRHRAENLCLLLGQDAHVIELGPDLAPNTVPPPAAPTIAPEPPAEPVELAREASSSDAAADAYMAVAEAADKASKTVTARAPRRR